MNKSAILNAVAANHMIGQIKGIPMKEGATGYMHNLAPEQQKEFQEMMSPMERPMMMQRGGYKNPEMSNEDCQ